MSYENMAETSPTSYSTALKDAKKERLFVEQILDSTDSRRLAYHIVRALEQKFGFFAIITSCDDLKGKMEELGVQWFINRGYTQDNEEELEEVPVLTPDMIDELAMDMHPWKEIEEDVYPHIREALKDTICSLFPIVE